MDRQLAAKRGHEPSDVAADENNETNSKRPKVSTNGLRLCAGECKEWKAAGCFTKNQKTKGSLAKCKPCVNALQKPKKQPLNNVNGTSNTTKVAALPPKQPPQRVTPPKKVQLPSELTCSGCKKSKTLSYFTKGEKKKGHNGEDDVKCKICKAKEEWETNRMRQEENARKLALPRECSGCEKTKTKEEYSIHQWSTVSYDKKQKGLVCYPLEVELADIEVEKQHQKALKLEKELAGRKQNWKESKPNILELGKQGAVFYDFDSAFESLSTREPTADDLKTLSGSYSIFFHNGVYGDTVSRTTQGTLTFAADPESRKLVGQIEFDEDVPTNDNLFYNPTYKIVPKNGELVPESGKFKVEDLVDPDSLYREPEEEEFPYADLKIIQNRVGLAWKPLEEWQYGIDGYGLEYMYDQDKLVKFDSLEEADALLKKQKDSMSKTSWINTHLPILDNEGIVKHIHEFVAWRPPPVLFLEPGDLYLDTTWDHCNHEGVTASSFFARKN